MLAARRARGRLAGVEGLTANENVRRSFGEEKEGCAVSNCTDAPPAKPLLLLLQPSPPLPRRTPRFETSVIAGKPGKRNRKCLSCPACRYWSLELGVPSACYWASAVTTPPGRARGKHEVTLTAEWLALNVFSLFSSCNREISLDKQQWQALWEIATLEEGNGREPLMLPLTGQVSQPTTASNVNFVCVTTMENGADSVSFIKCYLS